MTAKQGSNHPELKPGDAIGGYKVLNVAELKNIDAVFHLLVQQETGARHIHIANADKENTFSVAFKTVPQDSTGVAHILEHTALCGSSKYPVRDPFFSMLKRSLSTFMNAFTASDWTMYPFSTQNKKDFYNLLDVYLDAAFFPNLDELSFKQEGHRLETEGEGNDLQMVYKGVVYNEMKGAMSSPDQIMSRSLLNALYPDTTYQYNSGGDPAVIPSLTHEQLKAFHNRHYHPSNAYFYSYGDLPLADHLAFIEEKVLRRFETIDPGTDVPSQPRWSEPKSVTYTYPLDKNESPEKKYQVCVAWLLADIRDSFEVLALTVLEQILLGNASSPVRKALMDSGLGTALSDATGFDADNRDTLFSCGLKDVTKSSAAQIEKIIFDVLRELADKGIDEEMVASALHQIEFHRKEITNTPYPYGIRLLLTFGGSWFHGADPEKILNFDKDIEALRRKISQGPYLEQLLRTYFIDNPHRVSFTLAPDQEMASRENERVEKELAGIKSSLSASELAEIQEDAEKLLALQEKIEDITCLPTLQLKDIPPSVHQVAPTEAFSPGPELTGYSQATSGIFYYSAAIGAGPLPRNLIPMIPFFCYAFSKVGTALRDYAQMAQRMDLYTGGIGLAASARIRFDDQGEGTAFLSLNGKSLVRNQQRMLEIIQELVEKIDFTDQERIKQLLLEYRARMESMVIHNGHRLAMSLAARNFTPANALGETWGGVHQLRNLKQMTDNLSPEIIQQVMDDLAAIKSAVFLKNNMKLAVIGDADALANALGPVGELPAGLPTHASAEGDKGFIMPTVPVESTLPREGWTTSSAVSFVAQVFKAVRMGHPDAPALAVTAKLLRSLYLHREIREKGGAYGGFAVYNPEDGLFSLGSYRDPHIVNTLDVYGGVHGFLTSGEFHADDIKEAILQVCSEIDKPDPPGPAARKAFYRRMVSLTDEARLDYKRKLLEVTREDVMGLADKYLKDKGDNNGVAVITGEEQLNAANDQLGDRRLAPNQI